MRCACSWPHILRIVVGHSFTLRSKTLQTCCGAAPLMFGKLGHVYCFSQVFDSELCWLVLFTSLHALDVEDEAKRRFLLLPHYNKTFVTFASTTIEEQPDVATEFGVNMGNLPHVCA